MSGTNGLDLDIQDSQGNSVWDLLKNGDGSGLNFGDFGEGGNWKMPQFDFPSFKLGNWGGGSSSSGGGSSSSWNWGSSSPRPRPGSSGSGGSGGFGSFGFGGSWFPVIVLGIVVLGILLWVLLKNLRQQTPEVGVLTDGLGPWPIDPRLINTREDVVKAFEYLSVLICGPSAKTWTHNTIADALSDLAATHGETAVMLARLYELARYAPLDEPLTHDELMEARELHLRLAECRTDATTRFPARGLASRYCSRQRAVAAPVQGQMQGQTQKPVAVSGEGTELFRGLLNHMQIKPVSKQELRNSRSIQWTDVILISLGNPGPIPNQLFIPSDYYQDASTYGGLLIATDTRLRLTSSDPRAKDRRAILDIYGDKVACRDAKSIHDGRASCPYLVPSRTREGRKDYQNIFRGLNHTPRTLIHDT